MRTLLGGSALLLAAIALGLWLVQDDAVTAGIFVRTAAVMGAVWFAYPGLQSMTAGTWAVTAVGVVVVIVRPRAAWLLIPVILLVGFTRARQHRPKPAAPPDRGPRG